MTQSEQVNNNNGTQEGNEEKIEQTPVDSIVAVEIELGGYSARVMAYPPKNGGLDVTTEKITQELQNAGVLYGFDTSTISYIEITKKYEEWVTVAKCKPAENGVDGTVEYLFSKESAGMLKEDARGYVDFKNLGIVRNITKGTLIAKITKETQGQPGINVRNEPINPKPGVPAKVTFAENIAISDDGLTVVATADGNLTFKSGRFSVQTILKFDGDIDVATGNIDFIGEIVIRGDVREGFSVNSGKSITIYGGAFGSKITAAENILIRNGAIGSILTAGGTIEIDFGENSKINCTKLLKTRSLFFCDSFCNGEINVTSGNGSIVGGKTVSTMNVFANNIGSRNYTPTLVVIGDNAIMQEEKEGIEKRINQLRIEQDKCLKIIDFLKMKKEQLGSLDKDKQDIFNSALKTGMLSRNEIDKLSKRVEQIDEYLKLKQNLYVNCKKELNPGVKIVINDSVFAVNMTYQYCQIGLSDDGIEVRTL